MRKKQFEKISPRYQGKSRKKSEAEYLVDAFVHDSILAIDFYKDQNTMWQPLWRTLITEKEFCNYDFKTKCWNEKHIANMAREHEEMYTHRGGYCSWKEEKKEYEITKDAGITIETYIKGIGGFIYSRLEDTVKIKITEINTIKRETAEERKYRRIQEKMRDVPELPEDFEKFINDNLFKTDHFLYYSKEDAFCSRCGKKVTKTKSMKHNGLGECPKCGKLIRYKSTGRMSEHDERKEVLLIQKWKDEVILRYFRCSLLSTYNSKESLHYSESVRTYHSKKMEYYKARYIQYTDMMNCTFWSDKMNAWHQVAYGNKTCLYAGNMSELEELLENRFPIKELADEGECLPWKDMLRGQAMKNEIFERMYKAGLVKLSIEYIRSHGNLRIDYKQRELKKLLMVSKPMLAYMQKNNSSKKILEVLQDAKENAHGLNENEIFELAEAGIKASELKEVSEKAKIIKLLHYLQKVKGYTNLKNNFTHYADYLLMVKAMGYDLNNGTVRYPKDLRAAHDKAVTEYYDGETDRKKRKAMKDYPMIGHMWNELEMLYGYRDDKYIITAPRNAGDIIEEGRRLHHCVGGDTYLSRHNAGTSYILFMRKTQNSDESYYTIEIDPKDFRIMQYYGLNDKKPDKVQVDLFLDKWKRHLKRMKKKEDKAERPEESKELMAAV